MAIARKRLTLDQFLQLPEEEPALEYWHGEVTQKVAPLGPHSALQYGIGEHVRQATGPGRPFRIFPEARVILADVSTVPDLVIYRRERVPRTESGDVATNFTAPPDVAVEILSPGQSRSRTIERCRWYTEHGVALAIFVDSDRRVVRLFRPGAESGDLRGADLLDLGDVLPGFALTVDQLFAPLSADWV